MTASMSYEDPLLRQHSGTNTQRARDILRDTGKSMWSSGKSFGKIGALYASIECVIESVSIFRCIFRSLVAYKNKTVSRKNRHLQLGRRRLHVRRYPRKSLRPKSSFWWRPGVWSILSCNRPLHETRTT